MKAHRAPSQAELTLRARAAAHMSWAKTVNPCARTAPARSKFLERFEIQVDPLSALPEAERRRRAESARRAYFCELSRRSAAARRTRSSKDGS